MFCVPWGGRRGGLIVSVLIFRSSGLGSNPSWGHYGHYIVFLGKTLYSYSAFLHPGVKMGKGELNVEVTLQWRREVGILLYSSCYRNQEKLRPDGLLGSYTDLTFVLPGLELDMVITRGRSVVC